MCTDYFCSSIQVSSRSFLWNSTNQVIIFLAGYVLPDGKCQVSGRAALLSSSSNGGHKLFGDANVLLRTFPSHRPRTLSVTCKASNNHRRNPDFSRQHRGSSRGRNRQYHDRENSDSFEETDPLPSQNGSLLSLSDNQRYSATATPGRREKEIVELFRKVQAQLRERAAIKEEKKIEASQQGQGERGTVDSLLNLLRKHSVAQGKKGGRDDEFNLDQPGRSNSFEEEPDSNFLSSGNIPTSDEVPEPDPVPSRRPASNFRRRSPVPRVKFQPVFSAEEGISISSSVKSEEKKGSVNVPEPELMALEEPGEESVGELSDSSDTDESKDKTSETSAVKITDLASLKLSELRDIAKSRGAKGYSKLKKAELVKLLSEDPS